MLVLGWGSSPSPPGSPDCWTAGSRRQSPDPPLYLLAIYLVSRWVEYPRKATDRVVTGLVATAFALALLPLVTLVWTVFSNGFGALSAEFFTSSMRNVIGDAGGIYHAIWGTLIVTGLATLMSVPIGMFAAIYLVEYGSRCAGALDHVPRRRSVDRVHATYNRSAQTCCQSRRR